MYRTTPEGSAWLDQANPQGKMDMLQYFVLDAALNQIDDQELHARVESDMMGAGYSDVTHSSIDAAAEFMERRGYLRGEHSRMRRFSGSR